MRVVENLSRPKQHAFKYLPTAEYRSHRNVIPSYLCVFGVYFISHFDKIAMWLNFFLSRLHFRQNFLHFRLTCWRVTLLSKHRDAHYACKVHAVYVFCLEINRFKTRYLLNLTNTVMYCWTWFSDSSAAARSTLLSKLNKGESSVVTRCDIAPLGDIATRISGIAPGPILSRCPAISRSIIYHQVKYTREADGFWESSGEKCGRESR